MEEESGETSAWRLDWRGEVGSWVDQAGAGSVPFCDFGLFLRPIERAEELDSVWADELDSRLPPPN